MSVHDVWAAIEARWGELSFESPWLARAAATPRASLRRGSRRVPAGIAAAAGPHGRQPPSSASPCRSTACRCAASSTPYGGRCGWCSAQIIRPQDGPPRDETRPRSPRMRSSATYQLAFAEGAFDERSSTQALAPLREPRGDGCPTTPRHSGRRRAALTCGRARATSSTARRCRLCWTMRRSRRFRERLRVALCGHHRRPSRGAAHGGALRLRLPRPPRASGTARPRETTRERRARNDSVLTRIADALGIYRPTVEQCAVIEAPLGPALVVAGPARARPKTMAARVLWLVANGTSHPRACSASRSP